jgi:Zn-dependent protease/predicted transcriptional regulator
MKWSWRIGQVAGIGIYVHGTFVILLAWVALSHFLRRNRLEDALAGLVFILALFGIVVLHELGHALTAKRFGISTRDITLLPIGGVARLERMPDDPRQELLVALAGPAVNLFLAVALYAAAAPAAGLTAWNEVAQGGGQFLAKLFWVNVSLALFNLLPAFPMDGGRVLRAILAMRMDYVKATQAAAKIGQGMALLFGLLGLFFNPFLVFIALFVWLGADQEASLVQIKSALGGIPISHAMIKEFHSLSSQDQLGRAVELLLAGFQQDFPVLEGDRLVGVLTRADLLKGLTEKGSQARVEEAMQSQFETADPREMLESVFARLQACGCHTLPVLRGGHLMGLLTMENVGEFLMLQAALRGARA